MTTQQLLISHDCVIEGSLRDKFRLGTKSVVGIPSASEGGIVLFSPAYYAGE